MGSSRWIGTLDDYRALIDEHEVMKHAREGLPKSGPKSGAPIRPDPDAGVPARAALGDTDQGFYDLVLATKRVIQYTRAVKELIKRSLGTHQDAGARTQAFLQEWGSIESEYQRMVRLTSRAFFSDPLSAPHVQVAGENFDQTVIFDNPAFFTSDQVRIASALGLSPQECRDIYEYLTLPQQALLREHFESAAVVESIQNLDAYADYLPFPLAPQYLIREGAVTLGGDGPVIAQVAAAIMGAVAVAAAAAAGGVIWAIQGASGAMIAATEGVTGGARWAASSVANEARVIGRDIDRASREIAEDLARTAQRLQKGEMPGKHDVISRNKRWLDRHKVSFKPKFSYVDEGAVVMAAQRPCGENPGNWPCLLGGVVGDAYPGTSSLAFDRSVIFTDGGNGVARLKLILKDRNGRCVTLTSVRLITSGTASGFSLPGSMGGTDGVSCVFMTAGFSTTPGLVTVAAHLGQNPNPFLTTQMEIRSPSTSEITALSLAAFGTLPSSVQGVTDVLWESETQGRTATAEAETFGYVLGNMSRSKREVHIPNCRYLHLITNNHLRVIPTLQTANEMGLDNCHYCIGGSKR